jgi:5-oxoprolinase (ATP-hydrolysing)
VAATNTKVSFYVSIPAKNELSRVFCLPSLLQITDPEILERRYPAILHQFTLREGSGGVGEYRGGDGVIREIEFTE